MNTKLNLKLKTIGLKSLWLGAGILALPSLVLSSLLTYSLVTKIKSSNTDYELSVLSFYNDKVMTNGAIKNAVNLLASSQSDKEKIDKYNSFLSLTEQNNYLIMQSWSNSKNNLLDLNLNTKTFVKAITNSLDRFFESKAKNYLNKNENKLFYNYFNAGSHYSVKTKNIIVDTDQAWPFMDAHAENLVLSDKLKEEIKLSFFQFHETGHRMSYELVMNNLATNNSALAAYLINSEEAKNENRTGDEKFKKAFNERYSNNTFYKNESALKTYFLQHAESQADVFAILFISKKYPDLNHKNKIYFLEPLIEYRGEGNTHDRAHQTSMALELLKHKIKARQIDITKNLSLEEINEISHQVAQESLFKLIDDEILAKQKLEVFELTQAASASDADMTYSLPRF